MSVQTGVRLNVTSSLKERKQNVSEKYLDPQKNLQNLTTTKFFKKPSLYKEGKLRKVIKFKMQEKTHARSASQTELVKKTLKNEKKMIDVY